MEWKMWECCFKSLDDSKDITLEFLNEIFAYGLKNVHNEGLTHQDFHSGNILSPNYNCSIADLGLLMFIALELLYLKSSKRPTAEYLFEKFDEWWRHSNRQDSEICKQIEEADEFNKKQSYLTKSSFNTEPLYTTHPQAVYTKSIEAVDFTKFIINLHGVDDVDSKSTIADAVCGVGQEILVMERW
ncbi:hypothetical protein C1645_834895 [Glomus cerebriforme]|uniref:Protein kinase domain-containing protein n=1 Tax=Glomus cerebriforme TaxID=658196 RepID=A0A397SJN4_9GLOM|nr:hypothetical protein C1645_834895 [Glomus cerebriforme]